MYTYEEWIKAHGINTPTEYDKLMYGWYLEFWYENRMKRFRNQL